MYDLSIIIPFFHKFKEHEISLLYNSMELKKALELL